MARLGLSSATVRLELVRETENRAEVLKVDVKEKRFL